MAMIPTYKVYHKPGRKPLLVETHTDPAKATAQAQALLLTEQWVKIELGLGTDGKA